jgi:hypothetical protein
VPVKKRFHFFVARQPSAPRPRCDDLPLVGDVVTTTTPLDLADKNGNPLVLVLGPRQNLV